MDYQRLYEALIYIQKACNHCQNDKGCTNCPMGNKMGLCCFGAGVYPSEWKLEEPETIRVMV